MTTTNTLPTMNERGMPITTASRYRIERAVAYRIAEMTYEWIAQQCGYRSPAVAAANITCYVAWLNGQTGQPAAPGADPLTRAFGVEIEFAGITRRVAAEAISTALGRMVSVHHYHGTREYGEWKVEYDDSVTNGRGYGGEAVSPVLRGREGLDEMKAVMQALKNAGAGVTVKCGMHVHVDACDMTGEQMGRMLAAYVDRQSALDLLVSPSRRSSRWHQYCRGIGRQEKEEMKEALLNGTAHRHSRYRTVNITSLSRTGTLEFRQHQGTLNAKKAIAWIEMLLAMSNAVMAAEDETLPLDIDGLLDALEAYGLTQTSARYLKARAATASGV